MRRYPDIEHFIKKTPRYGKEKLFYNILLFLGLNIFYEPITFKLEKRNCYTPDFYIKEGGLWVELSCTRQSYHAGRGRIQEVVELHDLHMINVLSYNGKIIKSPSMVEIPKYVEHCLNVGIEALKNVNRNPQ